MTDVYKIQVILINYDAIPEAFASIFREAFNFKAAFGGALGYGISMAMKYGCLLYPSRCVYETEYTFITILFSTMRCYQSAYYA